MDILEELTVTERSEFDRRTGVFINNVVSDERAVKLADVLTEGYEMVEARTVLLIGVLALGTQKPRFLQALPVQLQDLVATPDSTTSYLQEQSLATLMSSQGEGTIENRATDLLIEAIHDGLGWIDLIVASDREVSDEAIKRHPSVAAATGLNHTVNHTVRLLLQQQVNAGLDVSLPKTKHEFLTLYFQAPQLFAALGKELQVGITNEAALAKGRCPAQTVDEYTQKTYLQNLMELLVKFRIK